MLQPSHLFGIDGLNVGSVLISCVIAVFGTGGIAAVWLRHRADNRRAENESVAVGESVTKAQFARLEAEIDRLTERVKVLEGIGLQKDALLAQKIAENVENAAKHAAEMIVQTALISARDAEIARLKILAGDPAPKKLIAATERNATANERLADAAEHAGETK